MHGAFSQLTVGEHPGEERRIEEERRTAAHLSTTLFNKLERHVIPLYNSVHVEPWTAVTL